MTMGSAVEIPREDVAFESRYVKGVRHLCESGMTRVPNKYVFPISDRPNTETGAGDMKKAALCIKLPVIDLSQLQGPNRPQVLKSIAKACAEQGFFQVINHGIPCDVIRSAIDVGRQFFDLPFEERAKYMSNDIRSAVRCGTSFNQNRECVSSWRDFLKLTCHPLQEVLALWPSTPVELRNTGSCYAKQARCLFFTLMGAVLESLGLGETDCEEGILREFEDGSQMMMINCYPSCPEPDLTLGMPPHSDYGFLTLLLQDGVSGLQVQSEGEWLTVEPLPNCLIVNVGDHLEIFSNGRYKSVLHRVLVNSSKSRISVASLHSLPFSSVVRPAVHLIDQENPRRYMDTDFASFLNYLSTFELKSKSFLESRMLKTDIHVPPC